MHIHNRDLRLKLAIQYEDMAMSRNKWTRDLVTGLHMNDLDEIPGMDENDVLASLRRMPVMSGKNVFNCASIACVLGVTVRHFTRNIVKDPKNHYQLSSLQIIRDDRKTKTTLYGANEREVRQIRLNVRKDS